MLLLALAGLAAQAAGCNRSYYRRQADADAGRLILQKSCDPRWDHASDGTISIDPQSRMFDPFSADHPPIPPDDPASHQLMRCVDDKPGYPNWSANGDTDFVENPIWKSYLPMNENGEVVLDLATAFHLAQIHSTDLQQQRETLYLSALDVSLERFDFDSKLFAGYESFVTTQGANRGTSGGSETILSSSLSGVSLEKLGITGTKFAVGLANTILWNFGGNNSQSASSLINFSVVQPLLLGSGRKVILESLTQVERTLLANVRQLDRYRRGFYLQIVTGRNPGSGPNLGGFFLSLPSGVSISSGGYLGLLEQQQRIRILEFNVRQLEDVLAQFREFFLRERINALQLRQFESTVYDAQESLLREKINYQSLLDQFKQTLGLPPSLNVVIRDPYLDRFEFISDEITQRQTEINRLRTLTGEQLNSVAKLLPEKVSETQQPGFQWPPELDQRVADLAASIQRAQSLIDQLKTIDKDQIEGDFDKLERVRPERVKYLQDLREAIARGEIVADIEPLILQPESIKSAEDLREQLQTVLVNLEKTSNDINEIQKRIADFPSMRQTLSAAELYEIIDEKIVKETSEQLSKLYNHALEMSLLQAQARGYSIELPRVEMNNAQAIQIARCFRRDWMNARASLVDQWRQIEVFANQLESQFDIVFDGNMGNIGDNPFNFRTADGQLRAGFRFDSPIVRLNQRNQYRQALINYQQARRQFYQFEDEIDSNLRLTLRNIDLNKILFELGRQNIRVAVEQVELARLTLEDPSATSLGATTARDLTSAINGLQNAQNQFLNVWVRFEVLRRSLDFDLGTFQIGPDGSWIDPEVIDPSIAQRTAAMMGVNLDDLCYCNLDLLETKNTAQPAPQNDGEISNLPAAPQPLPEASDPENSDFDSSFPGAPPSAPVEVPDPPAIPPPTIDPQSPKTDLNSPGLSSTIKREPGVQRIEFAVDNSQVTSASKLSAANFVQEDHPIDTPAIDLSQWFSGQFDWIAVPAENRKSAVSADNTHGKKYSTIDTFSPSLNAIFND